MKNSLIAAGVLLVSTQIFAQSRVFDDRQGSYRRNPNPYRYSSPAPKVCRRPNMKVVHADLKKIADAEGALEYRENLFRKNKICDVFDLLEVSLPEPSLAGNPLDVVNPAYLWDLNDFLASHLDQVPLGQNDYPFMRNFFKEDLFPFLETGYSRGAAIDYVASSISTCRDAADFVLNVLEEPMNGYETRQFYNRLYYQSGVDCEFRHHYNDSPVICRSDFGYCFKK